MNIPRFVIGGTRSGEGKTTLALGLMAALCARGLRVQGFKVGPDYLDTGYQYLATGNPGRNLDLWMMRADAVQSSVARHGGTAEVAVIEGVMGLFDGHRDGVTPTSSAEVAKLLGAPVVLVIDAAHLAASAGAIALGFKAFDPDVNLAGVILNRWGTHRSQVAVERALARAGVSLLGCLPPAPEIALPSRHLGLVIADEMRDAVSEVLERLAALVAAHIDLDAVLALARVMPEMPPAAPVAPVRKTVRVAVARDDAFAFYYPDNIECLESAGAEIVYFSPLADAALPTVDGLYLGGGYPELHAEALSANTAMRASIADAIATGLPTYAECGGLLYLSETLTDVNDRTWPLVGAVPAHARMHRRLQGMGYREGILQRDGILGPAGTRLRGHEFHYSSSTPVEGAFAYDIDGRMEGYSNGNLLASYLHLHFAGCPHAAAHWVRRMEES